jgi:hypothetical protein
MPSKYQQPYDRKKAETLRALNVEIRDKINILQDRLNDEKDPDMKKAIKAEIAAEKIRMKSINKKQPVKPKPSVISTESSQIEETKKGIDATKTKWISKIGGNKTEVTKFVNDKVKELENRYGDNYAAIVGTLKKILSNKYDVSLDEEAQGAITTGNIGVGTAVTNTGQTIPSPTGSSHLHPKHMGTFSRRGGYNPPIHDDGRKKKKKKRKMRKEFVEYYFEE